MGTQKENSRKDRLRQEELSPMLDQPSCILNGKIADGTIPHIEQDQPGDKLWIHYHLVSWQLYSKAIRAVAIS